MKKRSSKHILNWIFHHYFRVLFSSPPNLFGSICSLLSCSFKTQSFLVFPIFCLLLHPGVAPINLALDAEDEKLDSIAEESVENIISFFQKEINNLASPRSFESPRTLYFSEYSDRLLLPVDKIKKINVAMSSFLIAKRS